MPDRTKSVAAETDAKLAWASAVSSDDPAIQALLKYHRTILEKMGEAAKRGDVATVRRCIAEAEQIFEDVERIRRLYYPGDDDSFLRSVFAGEE